MPARSRNDRDFELIRGEPVSLFWRQHIRDQWTYGVGDQRPQRQPLRPIPWRRLLGAGVVAACVLLSASVVSADPFGTGGEDTGWHADSSTHTFCLGDTLTTNGYYYAALAFNYLESATDMTVSGGDESFCGAGTDAQVSNLNLGPGNLGLTDCTNRSGTVCSAAHLYINEGYISTLVYPVTTLRKTECHEIGHSVGLTHYNDVNGDYPDPPSGQDDCMISGSLPSASSVFTTYGTHHINHINGYY
jgi:hypothetical protein